MSFTRRPISSLIVFMLITFALVFVYFYAREGSFQEAGARMDVVMADLGEEAEDAAEDAVETTDAVIEDIADGPDDGSGE